MTSHAKPFGFGSGARLAGRKDFQRVVTEGRKTVSKDIILWTLKRGEPGGSRFGTSVSRKLGGAVRRNRIKRLLREAFRLNRPRTKAGYDVVAYPRPGCAWKSLGDVEESLMGSLRKGGMLEAGR